MIRVTKRKRLSAGSCNFCNCKDEFVYELSGDSSTTVRLCEECLVEPCFQAVKISGGKPLKESYSHLPVCLDKDLETLSEEGKG